MNTILYTDASTFNNGKEGQDSWCAVVVDDGTKDGLLILEEHLGDVTVSVAEYTGVLRALKWARESRVSVQVYTDSKMVHAHIRGEYVCASHLVKYRDRVLALMKATQSRVTWKRRDGNKAGWHFDRLKRERQRKARAAARQGVRTRV